MISKGGYEITRHSEDCAINSNVVQLPLKCTCKDTLNSRSLNEWRHSRNLTLPCILRRQREQESTAYGTVQRMRLEFQSPLRQWTLSSWERLLKGEETTSSRQPSRSSMESSVETTSSIPDLTSSASTPEESTSCLPTGQRRKDKATESSTPKSFGEMPELERPAMLMDDLPLKMSTSCAKGMEVHSGGMDTTDSPSLSSTTSTGGLNTQSCSGSSTDIPSRLTLRVVPRTPTGKRSTSRVIDTPPRGTRAPSRGQKTRRYRDDWVPSTSAKRQCSGPPGNVRRV
ncbi:hypothetical protein [Circovirus-like genome DCCV-11]|uniref:hypothetical protein n=1 Tax=Circovirus-like genome DCCV-11 TaxID=1788439 RepID=UPI0007F997B1|nr:hypothetical protein [Circovirus-like genome DCCV-11]AMB42984.1 hypothetical protein [Circovirus-like genome DCCV-11]